MSPLGRTKAEHVAATATLRRATLTPDDVIVLAACEATNNEIGRQVSPTVGEVAGNAKLHQRLVEVTLEGLYRHRLVECEADPFGDMWRLTALGREVLAELIVRHRPDPLGLMVPEILGRKNCSRCGRWLHVTEFGPSRRGRPGAQCRACVREYKREWAREHPGAQAEYALRHRAKDPDRARAVDRERAARAYRSNPRRAREVRAESWRRERADPERWARRLERQRMWAARRELRKRFAALLMSVLNAELVRRETEARAWREYKRGLAQALVERRRAAFLAGEVPSEPVFVNGALVRLPVVPLARWLNGQNVDVLARRIGVDPKALRRYQSGEAEMVPLEVVDAIVTRTSVMMFDIYPEDRYRSLYEVPDED